MAAKATFSTISASAKYLAVAEELKIPPTPYNGVRHHCSEPCVMATVRHATMKLCKISKP